MKKILSMKAINLARQIDRKPKEHYENWRYDHFSGEYKKSGRTEYLKAIPRRIALWRIKKQIQREGVHHSTGDWTLVGWTLDTGTYVSSPSCLRLTGATGSAICEYTGTTTLAQGKIISWIKPMNPGVAYTSLTRLAFRLQDLSNYYYAQINVNHTNNQSVIFGADGAAWDITGGGNTPGTTYGWELWRITYWVSNAVLFGRAEKQISGVWTKIGSDASDASPSWASGGKTALLAKGSGGVYSRFDDTEIWG